MNFSFEDALLGDEELEQYQDFIYDIADVSVFNRRNTEIKKDRETKNEEINTQKTISASPQNAFTWSTKEKNEFIAKMKLNEQKVNSKMIRGKPIEPYKETNVIKTRCELNEKSVNHRIVQN